MTNCCYYLACKAIVLFALLWLAVALAQSHNKVKREKKDTSRMTNQIAASRQGNSTGIDTNDGKKKKQSAAHQPLLPWQAADKLQKDANLGAPRSTYHPLHWVFVHYHKTGHDLIHHFSEPFRACNAEINFRYKRRVDGSTFASSILKNDDISLLTAPDMLFNWNDHFKLDTDTVRFVHFVRNPFDMIISAYLYHSQVPSPPPERWLTSDTFDPCAVDMSKTKDQYGSKLQQFLEAKHVGHQQPSSSQSSSVFRLIDQTVELCKTLTATYKSVNYNQLLQNAKSNGKTVPTNISASGTEKQHGNNNLLDGMRIEAARSILSSTGGDMLRMGANALFEAETALGKSRRVFLSDFPIGEAMHFKNTSYALYRFLMSMSVTNAAAEEKKVADSKTFWSCLPIDKAVSETMAAGYIDRAPSAQGVEEAPDQRQHVTAGFLTASQKEYYRQLLAADPVVGSLLTLLQDALSLTIMHAAV